MFIIQVKGLKCISMMQPSQITSLYGHDTLVSKKS
uniref:Uncharacterized protein n=1 Tax=Populus trichocarpa TaxID=3694 RepID=A0A3N7I0F6_POPTR